MTEQNSQPEANAEPEGTLDYDFPEGLHPDLKGLAWMVGHWEGHGEMTWPGLGTVKVLEHIDFSHNGQPYLHYLMQAYAEAPDGGLGEPMAMESGFWIPGDDNEVMVVLTNPEGVAQKWHGTVTALQSAPGRELGTKIEISTDAVVSQGTHTAGQRVYGYINGKMLYAYDRADNGIDLQSHLSGELERR